MNTPLLHSDEEPRIYWDRSTDSWRTSHRIYLYIRGHHLVVPAHYPTNLASVPFFLRPILSMYGDWNRASIIHDHLYEQKGRLTDGTAITRLEADAILRDIMLLDGASPLLANAFYLAVRLNPFNHPIFKPWHP